jgi:hypothetical protein
MNPKPTNLEKYDDIQWKRANENWNYLKQSEIFTDFQSQAKKVCAPEVYR